MSKNSKSTSMSSSSTEDKKLFKLSVEAACKVRSEDFIGKKDGFESSVCSGEPLLSLKLGKRAYFEDTSDGNNSKRTRSSFHNVSAAFCQVEGCNLDLSSAKDYHRKHKVCVNHSKSSKVVVNGVERRFCQQCSRFHGLVEFDENKRSCRKRLSNHNARRRRPHPNVAHYNPTIIYGGGLQQVFSRIPVEDNSKLSGDASYGLLPQISSSQPPPQHLHRALSLLSTDSSRPRTVPFPAQGPHFPAPAAPELWHAEKQGSSNPERLTMNHEPRNTLNFNNGNAFQECLMSKGQHEFGFGLMHLN